MVFFYYLIGALVYMSYEEWTLLDTIYFQTITLTTVGYGDFAPKTSAARVFTIFYIFAGLSIVLRIITDFASGILLYAEYKANKRKIKEDKLLGKVAPKVTYLAYWPRILMSFMSIAACLFVGTIFYMNNEGLDFVSALYLVVVTSSTVGYGDVPITYDSSRLFSIFYVLTSVVLVAVAIGNLASIKLLIQNDKKRMEQMTRKLDFKLIRDLGLNGHGIDKMNFLIAMLVNLKLVDKDRDVMPWLKRFDELDVHKRGLLDVQDVRVMEQEEERRQAEMVYNMKVAEKERMERLLGNVSFEHILARASEALHITSGE